MVGQLIKEAEDTIRRVDGVDLDLDTEEERAEAQCGTNADERRGLEAALATRNVNFISDPFMASPVAVDQDWQGRVPGRDFECT